MSYVIIRYGPYSAYGVIKHRSQKMYGLLCNGFVFRFSYSLIINCFEAHLDSLGYQFELIEISEYNRLTIEMCDREIFRCDIRNLMFNLPVDDDLVCQRAVKVIEEASNRMRNMHG